MYEHMSDLPDVDTDVEFNPAFYDFKNASENPPKIDHFYEKLEMNVDMLLKGIGNLVIIEASGGLGKTYNVKRILNENLSPDQYTVKSGKTTPLALYKILWQTQDKGHVLFLDDISGLTSDTAMELLKGATDTEPVRQVSYSSSRAPDHPTKPDKKLPLEFVYRGKIIMCSNNLPKDDPHFDAIKSRATSHYYMDKDFDYDTICAVIREVAKIPGLVEDEYGNSLTVKQQQECAEWIIDISTEDSGINLRTLEHVCNKRLYGEEHDKDWTKAAIDDLGMSEEMYVVHRLRQESIDPNKAEEYFKQKTGMSERTFWRYWTEVSNR